MSARLGKRAADPQAHPPTASCLPSPPPSQTAGFTIVAERLNYYRFLAHFRSIHRGAFFAQLRTTTVRKLLPDQWGFLCPVHTPDGAPCGLLSHLAEPCRVAVEQAARGAMRAYLLPHLAAAGVALLPTAAGLPHNAYLPVLLDGEVRCTESRFKHVSGSFYGWRCRVLLLLAPQALFIYGRGGKAADANLGRGPQTAVTFSCSRCRSAHRRPSPPSAPPTRPFPAPTIPRSSREGQGMHTPSGVGRFLGCHESAAGTVWPCSRAVPVYTSTPTPPFSPPPPPQLPPALGAQVLGFAHHDAAPAAASLLRRLKASFLPKQPARTQKTAGFQNYSAGFSSSLWNRLELGGGNLLVRRRSSPRATTGQPTSPSPIPGPPPPAHLLLPTPQPHPNRWRPLSPFLTAEPPPPPSLPPWH